MGPCGAGALSSVLALAFFGGPVPLGGDGRPAAVQIRIVGIARIHFEDRADASS